MASEGANQETGPTMCKNGCGFFGNSATMGLCSKCYRNGVLEELQAKNASASIVGAIGDGSTAVDRAHVDASYMQLEGSFVGPSRSPPNGQSDASSSGQEQPHQQAPNRCFSCKKRVGLTGFKCRCGDVFCSLHRYSEKHNCSFDYKLAGRDAIAKANPIVKASKITKI